MVDHFGTVLEVGDEVLHVWCSCSSARMDKYYVVGFTPQKVRLSKKRDGKSTACSPDKCYCLTPKGNGL